MVGTSFELEIASRLKAARAKIFPSAAAAAEALGMKAGTVRAHENGQNGVGFPDLVTYARRYGVGISWLITGHDEFREAPISYEDGGEEHYEIDGTIQDGVWTSSGGDENYYGPVTADAHGWGELAAYSDARFPADIIRSFKIKTDYPKSSYIDGSVLFVIPSLYADFSVGDHVVIKRSRGDLVEMSVREVGLPDPHHPLSEENVSLLPLISDSPALAGVPNVPGEDLVPLAIVVGSVSRRPVPGLSAKTRRDYEMYQREDRKRSKQHE